MNDTFRLTYALRGFNNGLQNVEEKLGDSFFQEVEKGDIDQGQVTLKMQVDKRSEMIVIDLELHGSVKEICDRCLAKIDMPISYEEQIIVKFGLPTDDSDTLIFLKDENELLDLTEVVYELICLSVPLKKVYNCSEDTKPPCDFNVLKTIDDNSFDVKETPSKKGVWDALKDLKK